MKYINQSLLKKNIDMERTWWTLKKEMFETYLWTTEGHFSAFSVVQI